ncbi:MAG: helix-turn-helix domain-containing protein, partial [Muribaculaceae bacterium]
VKQNTGKSPKTIIDQYLVLQLKKTLSRTPLSVKQIAWEYHFNDTAFLCRYFKAHTGRTPQQFRTDIREDIHPTDFQL